jgi:predicted negative regulator of RcsB-dependent stress response
LMDENLWQQAKLTLSKTALENGEYDEAIIHLDTLSNAMNITGAEAKYLLAKTYFFKGEFGKSDTAIYRLVDQVPSFPYWIAKGFILLADNFIAGEDIYNARVTFQSVIDNADNEELVGIAKEKLTLLNDSEKKKEEEMEAERKEAPQEIEFLTGSNKEKQLFEPDSVTNKSIKVKEAKDEN